MSLLAPLFLIGLLGIALPIWLHRMNTQSPERQRFSSIMLLEQSKRQTHVRKQLRYLLLLTLRIIFLVLIMFAFAKPFMPKPPVIAGGEGSVLHLIVLDTSMSMSYGDWSERARDEAREIISNMDDGDLAEIIAAGQAIEILAGPTNITEDLHASIAGLEPGYDRLEIAGMIANVDRLVSDYGQNAVIHFISDFQESGLPAKFTDLIPESLKTNLAGMELHPVVRDQEIQNIYIDSITRTDTGVEIAVVSNYREDVNVSVSLDVNGIEFGPVTANISSADMTLMDFPGLEFEEGENRVTARILNDDPLNIDNTHFIVIDNTPPSPVLLLTANPASVSVKYLAAAVESGQRNYLVEVVSINELDLRILLRYSWIIIDDLGSINEILVPPLQAYLDSGGAIFSALGERTLTMGSIPLLGADVQAARLSSSSNVPLSVARIEISHPALAETSGWRDISVSRYINLEEPPDTQVLVTLENGDPLVLERRFGRGRIIVLASGLDNRQSDIPIRPVFVNFLAEAGKYLSGEEQLIQNQIAGDFLQLQQSGSAAGQVIDPEGNDLLSLAETHRSQDIRLNRTGFYEIYTSDRESLVAVNTDLRESQMSFMDIDALENWRDAISEPQISAEVSTVVNLEQDSIEFWHILLLLMGIVVLAESLVANNHLGAGRGYT
jgi:hypothetical protein